MDFSLRLEYHDFLSLLTNFTVSMDKSTAISRMAETAWDRILELRNSELARRSSTARPPVRDEVLARYEAYSKQ